MFDDNFFLENLISSFEEALKVDMSKMPNIVIAKYLVEKLQTECGINKLDAVKIVAKANINVSQSNFDNPKFNQLLTLFGQVMIKAGKTLINELGYEEAIIFMTTRPMELSLDK